MINFSLKKFRLYPATKKAHQKSRKTSYFSHKKSNFFYKNRAAGAVQTPNTLGSLSRLNRDPQYGQHFFCKFGHFLDSTPHPVKKFTQKSLRRSQQRQNCPHTKNYAFLVAGY